MGGFRGGVVWKYCGGWGAGGSAGFAGFDHQDAASDEAPRTLAATPRDVPRMRLTGKVRRRRPGPWSRAVRPDRIMRRRVMMGQQPRRVP